LDTKEIREDGTAPSEGPTTEGWKTRVGNVKKNREIHYFAWLVGALAGLYLFGYTIAIPLFMILYLKWGIKETWLTAIVATAGVFAIYLFIFKMAVKVPFWQGVIFQ
jgi:hypothetical protein